MLGVLQRARQAPRYLHVGFVSRHFASSIARRRTHDGQRLILGIETSCDDSCAALVSCSDSYTASAFAQGVPTSDSPPKVVSSVIVRQDHGATAGIHPLAAQNYHMQALPGAIRRCLDEGGISSDGREVDAIAFTQGPGMPGCLSVGLNAAKTLASVWSKPLIPVHHMEAHALTPFLLETPSDHHPPLKFPFLTFLLSGGHTMLVLAKGMGDYQILANAEGEAIGASFDSAARYFALTTDWTKRSPGAALEAFAAQAPTECPEDLKPLLKPFKVPLRGIPTLAYSGSTSGVVQQHATIVNHGGPAYADKKMAELPLDWQRYIASQYQIAAFEQLKDKVKMVLRGAASLSDSKRLQQHNQPDCDFLTTTPNNTPPLFKPKPFPPEWQSHAEAIASCTHLIVSGGVASNTVLRSMLADVWRVQDGNRLLFPPVEYCVDNAVMIANVGALLFDQYVDDRRQSIPEKHAAAMAALPIAKWSMQDLAVAHGDAVAK